MPGDDMDRFIYLKTSAIHRKEARKEGRDEGREEGGEENVQKREENDQ